jgi:hypothetical protein
MNKKIIVAIVAVCLVVSLGLAYGLGVINYIFSSPLPVTPIPPPTIAVTLTDNGVVTSQPVIGDTVTLTATLSNSANNVPVTFLSCDTSAIGTDTSLGAAVESVSGVATMQVTVSSTSEFWLEVQCPS